ncbi:hypothetical protein NIES2104_53510 [Leptolyngbya sp. NIES-2104]|nr:hypothetical protein NIES2104_53510 [Leptolyngbya sp. NIES-2104]
MTRACRIVFCSNLLQRNSVTGKGTIDFVDRVMEANFDTA